MKKKLLAVLLTGAMLTAGLSTTVFADGEKTFVYGTTGYSEEMGDAGLNPHDNYSGWSALRYGVGETLFKYNDNMEVEPWLATDYEFVDDTTVKITLRDGVKFSSGRTMDAEAVKECLEDLITVHDRAPYDLKIDHIEADGLTLTIYTTEPCPAIINYLGDPYGAIIDMDYGIQGEGGSANVAGTGPYIAEKVPPTQIDLVKNYNQRLRSSTSSIPGNGNPFLVKDVDVNAIVTQCTTVSKVKETVQHFGEATTAYQSELGRLDDCCKKLLKRAEKAEKERDALEELRKNAETENLKNDVSELRKTNLQLRRQINNIRTFMQKYVINEVAIRHLVDIRILPLSEDERQQVLKTPEIWMNLLTEETDIQKMLSGAAEFAQDRPIIGTPTDAKNPEPMRNSLQGIGDQRTPVFSSFIELAGKVVFTLVFVRRFGYWAVIWTEPVIWICMVIPLIVTAAGNPVLFGKQK